MVSLPVAITSMPFLELEPSRGDRALPAHGVEHGVLVLQAEIAVARARKRGLADLAAHPHARERRLELALQRERELGDGEFRDVAAAAGRRGRMLSMGRRQPSRLCRRAQTVVKASPCESWWWAAADASMRCAGRSRPRRSATSSTARPAMPASPQVAECVADRRRGYRRPGGARPAREDRLRRGRAGGAAGRGPGRPARGGRHQGLRPVGRGGRSSKAPRASPRSSAGATTSRPPPTSASPTLDRPMAYIEAQGAPIVVKADGLAAGKGVDRRRDGRRRRSRRCATCWSGNRFGAAGAAVVIEEFLDGEEVSFFALVRRRARAAAGRRAGPQARRRRRQRPQHRRHGRLFAGADPRRRRCSERAMGEIILPTVRAHGGRGHAVQGRALCRPDDRQRTARSSSNTTAASAIRNARC